ncbi:MAG TPA: GNAT family N-acetyltransferase [Flavobacteriaceae bacterium]|nr:GNAT family N-acetyltransferase [Flavobacteriaceae bacterium]
MIYTTKPLSQNNLKDLKYLYKAVFGNIYSLEYIHKKYSTHYLDKHYFGHIAYDNNKPIAFHGAIPILMQYKNQEELSAQYGDAMTLPNYSGRGLFTTLGRLTDVQLKKAGIRFVWGFPNQNSEYGCINKLDWRYKDRMRCFKIKGSLFPLEKIFRKLPIISKVYDTYTRTVFEKYKVNKLLKGSISKDRMIVSTVRNKDYYTYKYAAGSFSIKIDDVLFWIKIKNGLLIGDVEASSRDSFKKSLKKLTSIAVRIGISELIIQTSPNTLLASYLDDYPSQKQDTWIVGYKNFSSDFPLEKLKFTLGDLDTF